MIGLLALKSAPRLRSGRFVFAVTPSRIPAMPSSQEADSLQPTANRQKKKPNTEITEQQHGGYRENTGLSRLLRVLV